MRLQASFSPSTDTLGRIRSKVSRTSTRSKSVALALLALLGGATGQAVAARSRNVGKARA